MSDHTNYGQCRACMRWWPRDEMLSINIEIFDATNTLDRVRLRLCPACHGQTSANMRQMNWKNELRTEGELRAAGILPPIRVVENTDVGEPAPSGEGAI